jgi:hypothetical protein
VPSDAADEAADPQSDVKGEEHEKHGSSDHRRRVTPEYRSSRTSSERSGAPRSGRGDGGEVTGAALFVPEGVALQATATSRTALR